MMTEKINLKAIKDGFNEKIARIKRRVIVCAGTGCVANGALEVHRALAETIADRKSVV